jgi:hypothetical protein
MHVESFRLTKLKSVRKDENMIMHVESFRLTKLKSVRGDDYACRVVQVNKT